MVTARRVRHIGASVRICDADASDLRPVAEIGKEAHPLVLVSIHVQVVDAKDRVGYNHMQQAVCTKIGQAKGGVGRRQLFVNDDRGHLREKTFREAYGVHTAASVLLGNGGSEETEFSNLSTASRRPRKPTCTNRY